MLDVDQGWFPTPASHRSGRAGLPHPARHITVSLRARWPNEPLSGEGADKLEAGG